ncbi:MAG: lipid kinase [Bacteroidaceae bacterium]|nr:lipid kinase [Bacteroidaceae bacterium]
MTRIEENRWGIIYVPKIGAHNSQKRWLQIKEYLEFRKVEYDHVQSDKVDSVERLTKMLIQNGYKTIVIVGGDESLNYAINGIMTSPAELKDQIRLGIIPNGIGNDFANFWGFSQEKYKQAIHAIIQGNTKKIDVGYCTYTEQQEKRKIYFLMAVNIGLSANIIQLSDLCRKIGGVKSPAYILGILSLLKERALYNMRLSLNSEDINQKIMTMCIGNSRGYGLTPSAVPYNSFLDVTIVNKTKIGQLIQGLHMLIQGKFMNFEQMYAYRTKEIEISQAEFAAICVDGRKISPSFPMTVSLEPNTLNVIIPS